MTSGLGDFLFVLKNHPSIIMCKRSLEVFPTIFTANLHDGTFSRSKAHGITSRSLIENELKLWRKLFPPPPPQMTPFLTSKAQKTPPLPATRREKKQYFFGWGIEGQQINSSIWSSSVSTEWLAEFLGCGKNNLRLLGTEEPMNFLAENGGLLDLDGEFCWWFFV